MTTPPFERAALRKALDQIPWPAFGIADVLVVDNGLDLASHGVQDACTALGINLLFTPPRSPWYKGTVERAGGTLNTRFIHWLAGTTLGRQTSDLNYDGRKHATLSLEDFELLLEQYIRTVHNKTPRRGKSDTPLRRFLKGIAQWPVRVPASEDELDTACALTHSRVLTQSGIKYLGLQYQNEHIGALWNRLPEGTAVTIKVNPLDLQTIKVVTPGTAEVIKVKCVEALSWPRTLSYHVATRQTARTMGMNPRDAHDLAVAEAQLKRNIEAATASSKKVLRRAQAQLYREAQAAEAAEEAQRLDDVVPPNAAADDLDAQLSKVFGQLQP